MDTENNNFTNVWIITLAQGCPWTEAISYLGITIFTIIIKCSQSSTNKIRFSNLFISVRRSTCFRRVFRPSSGAQNCTYSVRHLSDRYCYLLLAAGSSNGHVRQTYVLGHSWQARSRNLYLATHYTHKRQHPCSRRYSNPQSQQASGRTPTP